MSSEERKFDGLPATFDPDFHDKAAVERMQYVTLGNTGLVVSKVSFGTSALGSMFKEVTLEESIKVVHQAIKSGINLIDTSPWYGHGKSETVLGQALKGIPRHTYYMATKVGRYQPEVDKRFDFSAQRVIDSVDESLQRMALDYVDIIQVHDFEFAPSIDIIVNETLPALQKVKDSGKARYIGITAYPLNIFKQVIERSPVKIDTILSYCHSSMNDNSLQDYIQYFQAKGIGLINAAPFSMGMLTARGPPDWHPATPDIKQACVDAARYCESKSVDISRIAMKFTSEQPGIPTTLFSTASCTSLQNSVDAATTELSDIERETLNEVMERFMKPLKNRTWEGVDVKQYWEMMNKLKPVP